MLEANKKKDPLKSYYVKIRIHSVNQILKNKEKVTSNCNKNTLTRITDRKILCVYTHVYQIIKNRRPGPFNSLRHADNGKSFSRSLSNVKSRGSAHVLLDEGSRKNLEMFLLKEKATLSWLMNSEILPYSFVAKNIKNYRKYDIFFNFCVTGNMIFPSNAENQEK